MIIKMNKTMSNNILKLHITVWVFSFDLLLGKYKTSTVFKREFLTLRFAYRHRHKQVEYHTEVLFSKTGFGRDQRRNESSKRILSDVRYLRLIAK